MTTNDLGPSKNFETAALAAVVSHQLVDERDPSLEGSKNENPSIPQTSGARIVRHLAVHLYDLVFKQALLAVPVLANHKKTDLLQDEDMQVVNYALRDYSDEELRRVEQGNVEAVHTLLLALDHALNIFASNLLMVTAIIARGGKPPAPDMLAEQSEKAFARQANDRQPFLAWPDMDTALSEFVRRNANPAPMLNPVEGMRSVAIRVQATSPEAEA